MSKIKRNPKSKRTSTFTWFEAVAQVYQKQDLYLEVRPIGHHRQATTEVADYIVAHHGRSCVESSGAESGEIEFEGKRYSFTLSADLCESDVTFDDWSSVEKVEMGGRR